MLPLLLLLSTTQDPGADFYEAKVRPLFAEHCTKCHGETKQRAELRLDKYGSIMIGGEGGAVIVPGDVNTSRMLVAVRYSDEFLQMPPRNQLPASKIAILEEWIAMGAPGPLVEGTGDIHVADFDLEARLAHWAYQPVSDPAAPITQDENWGRDPLDSFIADHLLGAGLQPATETDRATWLRRVSYAITGLPPSPAERTAFLADTSPAAHERVVDRLLVSPHYGETWARHWLDLVRYGESRGHEFDYSIPNAHEYRDYLTRALNSDVPYDRFVTEHIAGDLVQEPRLHPTEGFDESILGTGFWHLGEEVHSPVDIRGDEANRVSNQIDVFSRTFLAMTVSCARCHDHKFDPIPTEDFYALAGFLNSSSYRQVLFESLHHNTRIAEELSALDSTEGAETLKAFTAALRPAFQEINAYLHATQSVLDPVRDRAAEDTRLPPGLELIFEDFETGSFGAWTPSGTSFGDRPQDAADLPDYHHLQGWRDEGFVCTHRIFPGESMTEVDAHQGRLLSPIFTIEHDHLHFLVCGGGHENKTCVDLLIDDKLVLSRTGSNDAKLRHASFDLSPWRGREARIEIVDDYSGGWGNIAADHFVLSDRADAQALDRALHADEHRARLGAVTEVAASTGLDPRTLGAWASAVMEARHNPSSPLHSWARLCYAEAPKSDARPASAALSPDTDLIYAYGEQTDPATWIQDGNLFGSAPMLTGSVTFGADASWPIAGISTRPAAYMDPTWAEHEFGYGTPNFTKSTTTGWAGSLNWAQSGRTLKTPTFSPKHGKLHYLVRGAGHCFASINTHRIIAGPLHAVTVKRFEDHSGWRWVTQDLSEYAGCRIHLEFTPLEGVTDFAIARITEGESTPPPPQSASFPSTGSDARSLAASLEQGFTRALTSLAESTFPEGAEGRDLASLLDWLVRRPELLGRVDRDALSRAVAPHFDRRAELLSSIQTTSRSAPAMLDGTGVNEHVFIRGNHNTLGELAPRRLPTALPHSEPIESATSGRLILARRLTDPSNPLLARVQVNRIWHHLFGRGLVSSVDDFGAQGTAPTHPKLLDHLTTRFTTDGWSSKRLIREIVLSATYRQSITGDPRGAEIDPKNLLLGRSPIRRLSAEAIRDGALAVSGSLDRTLYGPSVPVHLTSFMEGRGRPKESGPVDGANRRSLYISVPRNFLSPFFKVFDRPIPFTTQGRRSVSNVPAQSLTLMNDPLFEDLAERWAKRTLEATGTRREELIELLYLEAFARAPRPDETARLLTYLGDRDDEAAWADICHVLLNTKEFIFLN